MKKIGLNQLTLEKPTHIKQLNSNNYSTTGVIISTWTRETTDFVSFYLTFFVQKM